MPNLSKNLEGNHSLHRTGIDRALMDLLVPKDERASGAYHVFHRARLILPVLHNLVTLLVMIIVQVYRVVNKFLL